MMHTLSNWRLLTAFVLLGLSGMGGGLLHAQVAELPPEVSQRKSKFEVRPRDPFFPNSTKTVQVTAPGDKTPATPPVVATPISGMALRGITGVPPRRLALINNQTFLAGDEGIVRTANGSFNVKCREVREKSVVITIGNDPTRHELKLRD